MAETHLTLRLNGTQPLIMHNVQLADPQNFFTREIAKLTAKRTRKTEEDTHEIDRLSFIGSLYYSEEIGPYLPAENIFRSLQEAASLTRSGKKIERGVLFKTVQAPLEYPGPRDPVELWGDGRTQWVDRRIVAVQRQRIVRVRPIFREWSAEVGVILNNEVLDVDEFIDIAEKAGKLIGIGDYRRFFGRFNTKAVAA